MGVDNLGYRHGVFTLLTFTAVSSLITGQTQYVAHTVCEAMHNNKSSWMGVPDAIDHQPLDESFGVQVGVAANCSDPDVSARTSQILQLVQLVNSLPGIMVTGTMGVLSDAYGRKPIMLVGMSTLLASAVLTLVAAWFRWSYWWIIAAQAISGLTGNYVVILLAVFASVSDISSGATRTVNVALTEGGVFVGAAAGSAIFSQLAKHFPFDHGGGWELFALDVALFALALLWILFGLRETLPLASQRPFPGLLRANTLSSVLALGRNRTLVTLTAVFSIQCCTYFGFLQINQIYTETFFRWSPQRLGYYSMATYLCSGVGMLVIIPMLGSILKRTMPTATAFGRDRTILFIALVLGIGQYIAYGLIPAAPDPRSRWMSFAVASISLLVGVQPPVMRAMFSKQFSTEELGVVFGAIATVESVLQLVWPIVIEQIYRDSFLTPAITDKWHAAIYFFAAGLSLFSFLVLLSLSKDAKEFSYETAESDVGANAGVAAVVHGAPARRHKGCEQPTINGDSFAQEPLLAATSPHKPP